MPAVALYSSADSREGANDSLVHIVRELDEKGVLSSVIALDGYVAREFMWSGIDTTVLRRGPGEVWRLRGAMRTLGTKVLIVNRARDERIAAVATFGLDVAVIRTTPEDVDPADPRSHARAFAAVVRRHLRPLRSA